ncbi:MAG: hypothetical protein ACUVQU_04845 [Candidatus Bipolaricaulia bacterium]
MPLREARGRIHTRLIVFDASTLILLAKVELLRLVLREIEAVAPSSIYAETTRKATTDAKLIARLKEEGKLKVRKSRTQRETELLKEEFNLAVEAEAILLARELSCPVATDDKRAITVCKLLGLEFTTAIGFLIWAHERKMMSRELAREKLRGLQRYGRYSAEIIAYAEEKIGGNDESDNPEAG